MTLLQCTKTSCFFWSVKWFLNSTKSKDQALQRPVRLCVLAPGYSSELLSCISVLLVAQLCGCSFCVRCTLPQDLCTCCLLNVHTTLSLPPPHLLLSSSWHLPLSHTMWFTFLVNCPYFPTEMKTAWRQIFVYCILYYIPSTWNSAWITVGLQ